jgi:hypothetical protein
MSFQYGNERNETCFSKAFLELRHLAQPQLGELVDYAKVISGMGEEVAHGCHKAKALVSESNSPRTAYCE